MEGKGGGENEVEGGWNSGGRGSDIKREGGEIVVEMGKK